MPYVVNAIYVIVTLVMLPIWLYRALTTGAYIEGFWRKLIGAAPQSDRKAPIIWCHAAGIGEALVLRPLLERFRVERPDYRIVLSTYSPSAFHVAKRHFPEVEIFYAPLDFTWSVRRAYRTIDPCLLILSELELWPNLLSAAKTLEVPVVVVNSRMNDRDFRFFERIGVFLRGPLGAIRWWGAQTPRDADRISRLRGRATTEVEVVGSLKYEGAVRDRDNAQTKELRRLLGFRPGERILVAGSTHAPEEQVILEVFQSLCCEYPLLRLVVVPRDPARFHRVAKLLESRDVKYVRRSQLQDPLPTSAEVMMVDSVGELPALWGLADFAFVGGSLAEDIGGQNMIEPAGYGVPTCFGPHVWNFQPTAEQLIEANAAIQVESPQQLREVIRNWLVCPDQSEEMGTRAQRYVGTQAAAADKTFRAIARVLPVRPAP